jgi:hypothetical protein
MITVFGLLGATALWLTYAWLASAIAASYLSGRKGYSERAGLASGLLLNVLGVLVWLIVPPKTDSRGKKVGPFGGRRGKRRQPPPARPDDAGGGESTAGPAATG